MSFILDALKKAESERHRASGPVLVDVRIAPRRHGLPAWAWVLGSVLLVNLLVLIWLLLRKPAPEVAAASPAAAVAGSPQALAPAAIQAAMPAIAIPATAMPAAGAALPASPPAVPPLAKPEPAPAPPPEQYAATPPAAPPDIDNLPTLQDLQAAGVSLPPLLLNLHVYDPSPALRYVLLNGLRLNEGDFTPDGIKVEAIVERGVVLQARGRRFLLPAGGGRAQQPPPSGTD